MDLEEARDNLGRIVVYRPPGGRKEYGAITGVNDQWVFVKYVGSRQVKATPAEHLTLLVKDKED